MLRKIFLTTSVLLFLGSAMGQNLSKTTVNDKGQEVTTIAPSSFNVSVALRDLPQLEFEKEIKHESKDRKHVPNFGNRESDINPNALLQNGDPIIQGANGTRQGQEPLVNFNGLNGSGVPPDPSGAAGNDYYVQAVNTRYRVYNKTGIPEQTPLNLSTLWEGSTNDGDPIVMYDKHADRWFISQFQYQSGNKILIAVSTTSDPTGEYYTYSYNLSSFPDYPKFSIWWDGYYVSMNSSGATCGVFDRAKMLVGDASAEMIILNAPGVVSNGFRSMLPADADGDLPANGSPAYMFNLEDDGWFNASTDGVQVFKMTTDWDNTNNTEIVQDNFIETSSFDTQFGTGGGWNHIDQPETSQRLDAVNGVLMYRIPHRVWVGYNSIVMSHVVDVDGNDRAGVRWYELRQNGTDQWSLYQEGTYALDDDDESRWMSSIAMDAEGNIGLAYCVSSDDVFPSIRYTGRFANDDLGQMTIAEITAVEGEGSQDFSNRFGDYSHMSLDPNGYTFWHTGEFINASGNPRTRIFSFEISDANSIEDVNPYYANIQTNLTQTAGNLNVSVSGLYTNDKLSLDIFDLQGKIIEHMDVNPIAQSFYESISLDSYASGMYIVRFGNRNFQKVEKFNLAK